MIRLLLAFALLIPCGALAQSTLALPLDALTVPAAGLPQSCTVPASNSVALADGKVRAGLWAGLPIDSNPWRGSDRFIAASIRERMAGNALVPDGPPPSRPELATAKLPLADDIEEAYAAVYVAEQSRLVAVYATTRKEAAPKPVADKTRPRGGLRLTIGRTDIAVLGDGPCLDAIAAHLLELVKR